MSVRRAGGRARSGRRWIAAAIAAGLAVATAAPAAPSLAARRARFPPFREATAALVQEREVSLVDEVLRARGRIVLTPPDGMRLALTEPEPLTIVSRGPEVRVLDAAGTPMPLPPEASGLARFAHELNGLLLGGRPPAGLTERWDGDDVVTLAAADGASPFARITMRFPSDGPVPTEIVLQERGGDRTTIRLEDVRLVPAR